MACLGKTTNSSGSSSSESQSPVIPVVEITRIRTPTRPGASALPLTTTKVKREEGANTEINVCYNFKVSHYPLLGNDLTWFQIYNSCIRISYTVALSLIVISVVEFNLVGYIKEAGFDYANGIVLQINCIFARKFILGYSITTSRC